MFKKYYKVSWVRIEEMQFTGKGKYCQHELSKESAERLVRALKVSGMNKDIIMERDN